MELKMVTTSSGGSHFLLKLVVVLFAVEMGKLASSQEISSRIKRQVFANRVPAPLDNRRPETGLAAPNRPASRPSFSGSLLAGPASLQASVPDVMGDSLVDASVSGSASATLPATGNVAIASDEYGQAAPQDNQRPPRRRRPSRRRPNKQGGGGGYEPSRYKPDSEDEEEEEEDCYDDEGEEYDYGAMFHGMARNPMRQFSRMFGSAMNRMQAAYDDDYSGDYGGRGGSGARAISSAVSGGDGYSKAVSQVTNNGRSQGLISETSNGRTQTRRIGSSEEDEGSSYYA